MKAWLWQFLVGCVTIKVEGLKLLQFVSDAAAQGVRFQSLEREGYSRLVAAVNWRDYKRLVKLAHNRPFRIVELSSAGLPAVASKALRRLAFTIGMIACVAVLAVTNMFILDVRVTGCTRAGLEAKVLEIAQSQGLRPGAGKSAVDLHTVENSLMLQLGEISFAAVRVNGVVATVNVVEGVQPPQLVDKESPCNITATRDGVVRKVVVYDGSPQVAAGDTVKRGQLLVASAVTGAEGVRMAHARAEVMASVWVEGRAESPLFAAMNRRTGKTAAKQRLEFAGYAIPIGGQGPEGFARFDTEETAQYLLGQGLKGPKLVTTRYYETGEATAEKNFQTALDGALQQALESALAAVPQGAQMLGSRTDYVYEDGSILVRVFIEILVNIAAETPVS